MLLSFHLCNKIDPALQLYIKIKKNNLPSMNTNPTSNIIEEDWIMIQHHKSINWLLVNWLWVAITINYRL